MITTFDNGLAGIYVKQSPSVTISHAHLIGDMMHVYGNSDAGAYSWVTIEGGRLKLQKDNGTAGSPSSNTFDHICVIYDPVNGQPEGAFTITTRVDGTSSFTTLTTQTTTPPRCYGLP